MRPEYLIPKLSSVFVPGKTLFIHSMPDTVTEGIVILPSLVGSKINPQFPKWRNGDMMQIVSRSKNVQTSRDNAQKASDLLTVSLPEIITGSSIGLLADISVEEIRPTTDPIVFPKPLTDWWESSVNFYTVWYEVQK